MTVRRLAVLCALLACGARTETGTESDGDSAIDDAPVDPSTSHDASSPDGRRSKYNPCKTDDDCPFLTQCLSGICCRGAIVNGDCRCGAADGCDILYYCCVPDGGTLGCYGVYTCNP